MEFAARGTGRSREQGTTRSDGPNHDLAEAEALGLELIEVRRLPPDEQREPGPGRGNPAMWRALA